MKKIFFTALALMIAVTLFIHEGAGESAAAAGANPGQKPVTSDFTTLDGDKITLPLADGSISVINLWATWCPPCREEMPELEAFYRNNKNKVRFFAVNHQESADEIQEFMTRNNYTFPVLLDPAGAGARMLRTNGIPTTLVVDGGGVVVFRRVGPVTAAALDDAVNRIYQENKNGR